MIAFTIIIFEILWLTLGCNCHKVQDFGKNVLLQPPQRMVTNPGLVDDPESWEDVEG